MNLSTHLALAMPDPGICWRPRAAPSIAIEVNHIVIPAKDKHASAQLLAYILGLEVEEESGQSVRVRRRDGLTLDFSEPQGCLALQCALLVSETEFDAALSRISSAAIKFSASFDGKGCGEVNLVHGGRGIYFDDPDGHLFELIEELDVSAESSVRAVAIKWRA